jgi:hypothetical protein
MIAVKSFLHSKTIGPAMVRSTAEVQRAADMRCWGREQTAVNNLSFADRNRMTLYRLGLPLTMGRA